MRNNNNINDLIHKLSNYIDDMDDFQVERKTTTSHDLNEKIAFHEANLNHSVHELNYIKQRKEQEYREWVAKANQLDMAEKDLRQKIEEQSRHLSLSRANLEHSLRMLNLCPTSTSKDYLLDTTLNLSLNDALRKDWNLVGNHLAKSYLHNKK